MECSANIENIAQMSVLSDGKQEKIHLFAQNSVTSLFEIA
jgi:hypothetical protein